MTKTYPEDASFNLNNFSTLGSVQYNNTGAVEADFNLAVAVRHRGEVLSTTDGILQNQDSYYLSNNNYTVSFFEPPNATNLTLKSITVPDRFSKLRQFPTLTGVTYSNSNVVTTTGNNYIIDGAVTTWAVPESTNPQVRSDLLITVSGALQTDNAYVYPSTILGNQGIDLTDALEGANTTLSIRVFDSGADTASLCRKSSMSDRKPDSGFGQDKKFDVAIFESIAGYEKRRLKSRRGKRNWNFTYTNITGIEKEALELFYNARKGDYETFFFDLDHIEQVGTPAVRFDGPLQIKHSMSRGTTIDQVFYTVTLKFKEVYD